MVKRLIKQFMLITLFGLAVRALMKSDNQRARQAGLVANRLVGGVFSPNGEEPSGPSRTRRMTRSATSAAVGGVISYFFDPYQGAERRMRVRQFASERINRNNGSPTESEVEREAFRSPQVAG